MSQSLISNPNSTPKRKPTSPTDSAVTSPHVNTSQIEHTDHQTHNANDLTVNHPSSDKDYVGASHLLTHTEHEAVEYGNYHNGYHLQLWVYETSGANMTVAERLEKSKWEAERLERL
jgi:hypothetical protein